MTLESQIKQIVNEMIEIYNVRGIVAAKKHLKFWEDGLRSSGHEVSAIVVSAVFKRFVNEREA